MIGVASYAEKAIAAVERNRAALTRDERRLAEHDAARPEGDDADTSFVWKRERRDLEDRVEADREALAFAEKRAAEARADEERKAADAEAAAEEKAAAADVKLVDDIDALVRKLAAARAKLSASNDRTAAYNARRGNRPFVAPGEDRARRIPGRTIPASYRDEVQWRDGAGRSPYQWRKGADGELEPIEAGFERQVVQVCQSEAREVPPTMPESYMTALILVDRAGKAI